MVPGETLETLLASDRKIAFSRFHVTGSGVLRADGRFSIVVPRLGEDQGRWWLDGDRICSRWDPVPQGAGPVRHHRTAARRNLSQPVSGYGRAYADFTVQE